VKKKNIENGEGSSGDDGKGERHQIFHYEDANGNGNEAAELDEFGRRRQGPNYPYWSKQVERTSKDLVPVVISYRYRRTHMQH
jgi:hypothetical protein